MFLILKWYWSNIWWWWMLLTLRVTGISSCSCGCCIRIWSKSIFSKIWFRCVVTTCLCFIDWFFCVPTSRGFGSTFFHCMFNSFYLISIFCIELKSILGIPRPQLRLSRSRSFLIFSISEIKIFLNEYLLECLSWKLSLFIKWHLNVGMIHKFTNALSLIFIVLKTLT